MYEKLKTESLTSEDIILYQKSRHSMPVATCHAIIGVFILALPLYLILFVANLFGSITAAWVVTVILILFGIKILFMCWEFETVYRNGGIKIDLVNGLVTFYQPATKDDVISTKLISIICTNIGRAITPWKLRFEELPVKKIDVCRLEAFVDLKWMSISRNENSKDIARIVIHCHDGHKFQSPDEKISRQRAEQARTRIKQLQKFNIEI